MFPNTYYDVASQQVSKLPLPIAQIEGYFKGAANAWLQIHDSCTTPAANAVPVLQIPLNAAAQFFENLQIAHVPISEGIFIGVSSTEGTWTASADKMDLTVWTEQAVTAANIVGDKTTTLNTKQIWAEADANKSTKRLYGLIITEQLGAARFIIVYADDAKVGRFNSVIPLAANQTLKLTFGDPALKPATAGASTDTAAATGARLGCTVVVADAVPAEGVAPTVTANSATILAITN